MQPVFKDWNNLNARIFFSRIFKYLDVSTLRNILKLYKDRKPGDVSWTAYTFIFNLRRHLTHAQLFWLEGLKNFNLSLIIIMSGFPTEFI